MRLFLTCFVLYVLSLTLVQASKLNKADSLFNSGKYTQAYELYEKQYASGSASASMLLKMAYIEDASANHAEALYFLNQYYRYTADREVLGKIDEIATSENLSGYTYTDTNYFSMLFGMYRTYILLGLVAIIIALGIKIYVAARAGEREIWLLLVQACVIVLFVFVVNYESPRQAIIATERTLLRAGPSAAAEPVSMITKGNKVRILSESDVWIEIVYEEEKAYIKRDRVLII